MLERLYLNLTEVTFLESFLIYEYYILKSKLNFKRTRAEGENFLNK